MYVLVPESNLKRIFFSSFALANVFFFYRITPTRLIKFELIKTIIQLFDIFSKEKWSIYCNFFVIAELVSPIEIANKRIF